MAITGWELFRDRFAGFEDSYVVIGGFACEVLIKKSEREFRATKDIDMIVLIEGDFPRFGHVFWEFIKEGQYKCGWKQNPELHFYRFTSPKSGYPVQIELFSRIPDKHFMIKEGIVPIHIDDEVSSLSAIVLNEEFYQLIQRGKTVIDGISTLEATYLIPFKMFAWINLLEKKANGEHVNERDLKKHKYDVFRLLEIVPDNASIQLSGLCADTVNKFLELIVKEPIKLDQIGLSFSLQEGIERLRDIYVTE